MLSITNVIFFFLIAYAIFKKLEICFTDSQHNVICISQQSQLIKIMVLENVTHLL